MAYVWPFAKSVATTHCANMSIGILVQENEPGGPGSLPLFSCQCILNVSQKHSILSICRLMTSSKDASNVVRCPLLYGTGGTCKAPLIYGLHDHLSHTYSVLNLIIFKGFFSF